MFVRFRGNGIIRWMAWERLSSLLCFWLVPEVSLPASSDTEEYCLQLNFKIQIALVKKLKSNKLPLAA
ncbi:hypothetical protein VNO77_21589 [Canavalia gladiata]|uniref:Secreted protein n=1 Tax=Canavalia gladiata TaxID=3824 RepID=A0AAN9LRK5_CANGL